ncbi:DUF455 family protein [Bacteriovorax sp. Seq25_V]|uniref:DUF455 family protein n=1 Tax=Bacteriovorax sp. Seq25_V TaxID=1201288 RepID=UPI000389D9E9|nr:DUF455 family protein [Bacteriovorax sp. Seq25_V]EQC47184.1 PF04305 family protein [Bacteriovorax sp. Seq25_V]
MNVIEYAKLILNSSSIEDKLLDPSVVTSLDGSTADFEKLKDLMPAREPRISFSSTQIKFPRKNTLHLNDRKALALHFFANHELLAIEMMAAALLYLPLNDNYSKRIRMGILQTIKDEQKHFKLYRHRMNDFGIDFGDFPVNDFFWRQMQKMKSINEYLAVISLTFEAANLDFAKNYGSIFAAVDDDKTAKIMDIVYQDEISHVAFGVTWLNKWKEDKSLWQYYVDSLPDLLTPARSKGTIFDFEGRVKSGMDEDFVSKIRDYRDEFTVTNRKEWNEK